MILIREIRVKIPHTEEALEKKLRRKLRVKDTVPLRYQIRKHSIDARKKPDLFDVYTVEVSLEEEKKVLSRLSDPNISIAEPEPAYVYPKADFKEKQPVIIGTGPAGLFCAYALIQMGARPLLIERGAPIEKRTDDVHAFWDGGEFKENSNVQFGEGGAGTFSDGKLTTMVRDLDGRHKEVLRILEHFGAPKSILYEAQPHIGTDRLSVVVKNLREYIIHSGGEFRFYTEAVGIEVKDDPAGSRLTGLHLQDTRTGEMEEMPCTRAVFAIGHSARDTFAMLQNAGIKMEPKPFAVGVRIEHPQAMVNACQYGEKADLSLPPASYKLTTKSKDGRGVYTFCMCPGGSVINASSEAGRICVNGMSDFKRDGSNANSAVVAQVGSKDFETEGILSGMEFQRRLEEAAYLAGRGKIPVQLFSDFYRKRPSTGPGDFMPQIKGGYTWSDVRSIFPDALSEAIAEGICSFDQKMKGFARPDAILSGVESRTSSPVRILRDETMESSVFGLYPCGEGAGYAGGITSAAMDGMRVAEALSKSS